MWDGAQAPTTSWGTCAHCERLFHPRAHRGRERRYCSERCRVAAYRPRRAAERPTFSSCEVETCETPRRSRNARWCEMHYMRWYRDHPVEDGRLRGGTCHHCGKPTGSRRRYYCSTLCRTRTRIGVPYEPHRTCVVCGASIEFDERYNRAGCCSTQCSDTVRLTASYGMTPDQYRSMYEAQGGACAVCHMRTKKLNIDHHHRGGFVRGLLCNQCNLGLGLFQDDSALLRRAADYLDQMAG